jgi:26S proteasome regulatory subunit N2
MSLKKIGIPRKVECGSGLFLLVSKDAHWDLLELDTWDPELRGISCIGDNSRIADAFEMKVIAWSPNLTPERAEAAGATFIKSKEELLSTADVVSLHMVLAPSTRHILKAEDLKLMKPTAFLVNTSRGPLIDEAALVDILKARKIAGAALDVFDVEPLPQDHVLRKLDNVLLSPHLGYIADENYTAFWGQTAKNVQDFISGNPLNGLTADKGMQT